MTGPSWERGTAACILLMSGLVTCSDRKSTDQRPAPALSGSGVPSAVATSSNSAVPSSDVPLRDCASTCNDYWMFAARERRLCGEGSHFKPPQWSTGECWRARSDWAWSRVHVDASGQDPAERQDGALCDCGRVGLPNDEDRPQVPTSACESVCLRAQSLRKALSRGCGEPPESKAYADPRCDVAEQQLYETRSQILECWCHDVAPSEP